VRQALLYLPVLHAGYESFLGGLSDVDEILLLGRGFAADFPVLGKEIRALDPARAAAYLTGAGYGPVRVIEPGDLPGTITAAEIVAPDEDVLRDLLDKYGWTDRTTFVRTFLRWDRPWSLARLPAGYTGTLDATELSRRLMGAAAGAAERSSDWWRQVGAVAARGGEVIDTARNAHQPTDYSPYIDGDPRNNFHRGERADLSTALHAEAAIVARAAREGYPLAGADLYVTTFPCPACARLVAAAGFARCYFAGPYAVLAGDDVLRAAGVELIWVDLAD
jgi:dCMP deaminase